MPIQRVLNKGSLERYVILEPLKGNTLNSEDVEELDHILNKQLHYWEALSKVILSSAKM